MKKSELHLLSLQLSITTFQLPKSALLFAEKLIVVQILLLRNSIHFITVQ